MTLTARLIGEGVRMGASIEGLPLTVENIYRLPAGDFSPYWRPVGYAEAIVVATGCSGIDPETSSSTW
jgi:hypothetical protein